MSIGGQERCPHCGAIWASQHGLGCPYGPSDPGQTPSKSAGSGCLGAVGCLVVVLVAAVAILGFFWQALLGAVLPNRGMSDDEVAAMEALVENQWTGHVTCGELRHGVTLDFERLITKGHDVSAEVSLHRGKGPRSQVVDTYELEGTFDGTRLEVIGDGWSGGSPDRFDLVGHVEGEDTGIITGATRNQVPPDAGRCRGTFRISR